MSVIFRSRDYLCHFWFGLLLGGQILGLGCHKEKSWPPAEKVTALEKKDSPTPLPGQTVVARLKDDSVTLARLSAIILREKILYALYTGKDLPIKVLNSEHFKKNALRSYFFRSALIKAADEKRVSISPEEIQAEREKILLFQKAGQFDPESLRQWIRKRPDHESLLQQILTEKIQGLKFGRSLVGNLSQKDLWAMYQKTHEKVNLEFISVPVIPSFQEISRYVKSHLKEISADYEKNKEKMTTQLEFEIQHIQRSVSKTDPVEKIGQQYRRLKRLKNRLTLDNFGTYAKKVSEAKDASQGGNMGFINPFLLGPEFGQALKKLPENQISDVIRSNRGFHLAVKTGRKEKRQRLLDLALKREIAAILLKAQPTTLKAYQQARKALALYQSPTQKEALAQLIKSQKWLKDTTGLFALHQSPGIPKIGLAQDMIQAILKTKSNGIIDQIFFQPLRNRFYLIKKLEHQRPDHTAFLENREKIKAAILEKQSQTQLMNWWEKYRGQAKMEIQEKLLSQWQIELKESP